MNDADRRRRRGERPGWESHPNRRARLYRHGWFGWFHSLATRSDKRRIRREVANHSWRRRRSVSPIYLQIADHDNQRFTIEGPVTNDNDWIVEVFRARQTGRSISFRIIECEHLKDALVERAELAYFEEWPSRSIIAPR